MVAQRAVIKPGVVTRFFVSLTVVEGDEQVFLVIRQGDVPRVGYRSSHVPVRIPRIIDQDVGEQLGFGVLFADTYTHVVDSVEKDTVLEFDRLFLLANVIQQCIDLLGRMRHQVVGDEETADRDRTYYDNQRAENARQRNTR